MKSLVIFPGECAEYFIHNCEEILKVNPNMYFNGSWSFGDIKEDEERCCLFEALTTEVTPVKLSTVVEAIKECAVGYKRNWKVYLYKD